MLTRSSDRGHMDGRAPAFRIVLHAQAAPLVQGALFPASRSVEPNTEPPCDHPEGGRQRGLFGAELEYCCTFCGAELPEPAVRP